jgi:hypothetical protein
VTAALAHAVVFPEIIRISPLADAAATRHRPYARDNRMLSPLPPESRTSRTARYVRFS